MFFGVKSFANSLADKGHHDEDDHHGHHHRADDPRGVQVVGPLPGELQNWLVNTSGISATANEPDAAKAFIKYLATPEAAAVIKERGMDPLGK